ncbi:alpha/beta fold hydrolase, partial [Streptomyces sp. NPDC058272]
MTGDRIALAVHDHGGDGPPLVLLHGAGRTLADWAAAAPLLVPRHRVLAVDLRGHGLSPSGTWDFPHVLGDLEAVLEAYDIPGALPVGHSLGGMIAVRYALEHPGVTPGAVNFDGFGWGSPDQYV